MITMPMEIDGVEYLNMEEAAEFLGYSRTNTQKAIGDYEKQVGHTIRIRNSQYRLVKRSDVEAILIQRKPFEARRRGLIKE